MPTVNPIYNAVLDGRRVEKVPFRQAWSNFAYSLENVAALRDHDGRGQKLIFVGQNLFKYDAADTTTPDDGINCVHDNTGKRYKWLQFASGGLDEAAVRATLLSGASFTSIEAVTATDSILVAMGKLQARTDKAQLSFINRAAVTATNLSTLATGAVVDVRGHTTAGVGRASYLKLAAPPTTVKAWHLQSSDGAYFQLIGDYITPDMFGATGANATLDTPALTVAAEYQTEFGHEIKLLPKLYRTATSLSFKGVVSGAGSLAGSKSCSGIMCTGTMDAVVVLSGSKAQLSDLYIHGSFAGHPTSAKYGVLFQNANSAASRNVTVEYTRIDGFAWSDGAGDNNNFCKLDNCRARWCGTIRTFNVTRAYPSGGLLYRPANVDNAVTGTIGSTSLTLTLPWTPADHEIDVKRTVIWVDAHQYVITAVTTTTLTVSPALRSAVPGSGFSLHNGCGIFVPHHTDNNGTTFINNLVYGCANASLWDQSFAGGKSIGNGYEWAGVCNIIVGHPSNAYGRSKGFSSDGDYTEQGRLEWWALFGEDIIINTPKFSQSLAGRTDTLTNASGRDWWKTGVVDNGSTIKNFSDSILLDFDSITNPALYELKAKFTRWRQSPAGVDFDVVLPDAPYNTAQPETYIVHFTNIGGKIATFKTVSATTLINGVAGTTGVQFRGSNRVLTATWDSTLTTWFVSGTTSYLTANVVYDAPSLADGAGATSTIAVTGAAFGDLVDVVFSIDLQGLTLTSWISAADTVSFRIQNETGATVDLASANVTARVTDLT